ncbi:MAG: hypothetical protein ACLGIG_02120 [Actinomycetes bacterium]
MAELLIPLAAFLAFTVLGLLVAVALAPPQRTPARVVVRERDPYRRH